MLEKRLAINDRESQRLARAHQKLDEVPLSRENGPLVLLSERPKNRVVRIINFVMSLDGPVRELLLLLGGLLNELLGRELVGHKVHEKRLLTLDYTVQIGLVLLAALIYN